MSGSAQAPALREHGNAYNIFILVLTLLSLFIMVLLILPVPQSERDLLTVYDNVICLVFLADFAYNLTGSRPKEAYFIHSRGWLDLLGSIPSLGVFQLSALFRLARLSRLARIGRLLRGNDRKALVRDVLENRGQYATFITILAGTIVLVLSSILVLYFEAASPDANIKTGGDALWWGVVTITTVGYGDRYPVTTLGRLTGFSVMMAGVGIIGALASILASLLVSSPAEDAAAGDALFPDETTVSRTTGATGSVTEPIPSPTPPGSAVNVGGPDLILAKLDQLQAEMAELRREVAAGHT